MKVKNSNIPNKLTWKGQERPTFQVSYTQGLCTCVHPGMFPTDEADCKRD